MNILSTSSVNFNNAYRLGEKTSPQISMPKFGLKMAQPLSNDTLSFKAKNRAAKKAIKIPAKKAPVFKAGKGLKETVNK